MPPLPTVVRGLVERAVSRSYHAVRGDNNWNEHIEAALECLARDLRRFTAVEDDSFAFCATNLLSTYRSPELSLDIQAQSHSL